MASIEKIQIKNFKSHKDYSIKIDNKFKHIVIFGNNGVGKTNLLEGFSFFSNSKGLRGDTIEKIIPSSSLGLVDTQIDIEFTSNDNLQNVSFKLDEENKVIKKTFFLNHRKTSLSNIRKYVSFIWLSPYMDKIMYEGQSIKRSFIDKMISQNDKYFNKTLLSYKKDISERLIILKNSKDEKWLDIIEKQITESFYFILQSRRKYAEKLNKIINNKLKNFREVELRFLNNFLKKIDNKEHTVDQILEKFKVNRTIDEISKRTNFSINSDEIIFYDVKNEINTDACSTGEQKSSLLTIILGNCWKLKEEDKEFILLLDEATSHIDDENFEKLFNEVDKFGTQIWYTGTSRNLFQVIENKGFFIHLE